MTVDSWVDIFFKYWPLVFVASSTEIGSKAVPTLLEGPIFGLSGWISYIGVFQAVAFYWVCLQIYNHYKPKETLMPKHTVKERKKKKKRSR